MSHSVGRRQATEVEFPERLRPMVTPYFMLGLATLFVTWPIFILPVILGLLVLIKYRSFRICQAAGIFTLKPIIATPIWGALLFLSWNNEVPYYLTLLPGAIFTITIVFSFRRLFLTNPRIFTLLLLTDVLRWLMSFTLASSPGQRPFNFSGSTQFITLSAYVFPSIYAMMALFIGIFQTKRQKLQQPSIS